MKLVKYCTLIPAAVLAEDVTASFVPYYPANPYPTNPYPTNPYPTYPSWPAWPPTPSWPTWPSWPPTPSWPSWPSWPPTPSWPNWPPTPSWPSWPGVGGCSSHSQCGSGQYCYSCAICLAKRGCTVSSTCRLNPTGGECAPVANCYRDMDPIDGQCPVGGGGGGGGINPCAAVTCRVGERCVAEPKQCVTWPCDQFRCEPVWGGGSGVCSTNPCAWNERCVPTNIYCIRAPCPQYTCVPLLGGGGGGGRCDANEQWEDCGSSSCWEDSCDRDGPWPPEVCTADCRSGCKCKPGYKRNYNGACVTACYVLGRPYTTEKGEFLMAPVSAHSNNTQSPAHEEDRIKAAEYWAKIAMMEHASVASFSRFSLELMSIGAPMDLLAGAHAAALDEVRHTQVSLDIANEFGASTFTPGAFPITDKADFSFGDVEKIAVAAALDGCIEETLAASVVLYQAEQMENPKHKELIRAVALDEANHAAFAWRAIKWMISSSPEVRDAVSAVFRKRAEKYESFSSNSTDVSPLQRLGLLDKATTAKIQHTAWNEIVAPAAALLGFLPRESIKMAKGPIADVIRAAVN